MVSESLTERLRPGNFLRTAHRGARGLAPENTLEAFGRAVEIGVDVLELDVQATADGEVVVLHDDTLDRTTDWGEHDAVHPGPGRVSQLDLAAVQRLDAGYRFTPDEGRTFPFRGRGVRVPRLEEVLDAFPEQAFTIELKPSPHPEFLARVADVVRGRAASRSIVSSFGHGLVQGFRKLIPGLPTGFSGREIRDFFVASHLGLGARVARGGRVLQIPTHSNHERGTGLRLVTRRTLRAAHARSACVQVWTINDPDVMRSLIELGVDGITTDRPDLLNDVLARLA